MPAHAAPRRAVPALPVRRRRGKHAAPRSTSRTLVVPGVALTATGGFVALSGSAAGSPARTAEVRPAEVRPVALPAWTGAATATPPVATPVLLPAPEPERASRSADRTAPSVVRPVDGPITSGFGRRWGRLHAGLDFGVPVGTEVRAAQAGTVQSVTYDAGGYGKHVVLVHPDGTTTLYGHLSQVLVTGGAVAAGQVIALSGNTGHSTGPHLHFEVRGAGGPVDPRAWLAARGVEL